MAREHKKKSHSKSAKTKKSLSKSNKKDKSRIIYLDNSFGKIEPTYDLDIATLSRNLLVSGPSALESIKVKKHFYCEDNEAVDFLKNILPRDIRKKIEIFPAKLSSMELKELAKKNLPDFKDSIIVLDGDSNPGRSKNIISLPGTEGPDALIFKASSLDISSAKFSLMRYSAPLPKAKQFLSISVVLHGSSIRFLRCRQ